MFVEDDAVPLNLQKAGLETSSTRQAITVASLLQRHKRNDAIFQMITRLSAVFILLILFGIITTLFVGSLPAIKAFGFAFFANSQWDPVANRFGALVPIYGTVMTSLIALVIGVPLSFGIALFQTELAPKALKPAFGVAIELLAAIPSIIYGMWGLFVFVPFFSRYIEPWVIEHLGGIPGVGALFQGAPMGVGIFTAGFILAIMIVPFISSVMRDVFETVPAVLKESAYGLGANKWEVVRTVVVPHTRVGCVGGIMLGLGRALGETMAVTFVIGNAHDLSASILMPGNTISSSLANEFTEAIGDLYTSSLIELGLILFVITFIVVGLAKVLLLRLKRFEGKQA